MEELWKPITVLKYQDQMTSTYEASNLGRIRNARTKHVLKPHMHNSGYQQFQYRYRDENDEVHWSGMIWHRIIALTWIPNPDNLPQVDHIDHDVTNNEVSNLRWVSAKQNQQNCRPHCGIRYSRFRKTKVIDKEGNEIAEYPTLIEACEAYGVRIEHALEMMHGRRPAKAWGTFQQKPYDD